MQSLTHTITLQIGLEIALFLDFFHIFINLFSFLSSSPEELVRPRISLTSCIESFAAVETIDDFYSSALQSKSIVHK